MALKFLSRKTRGSRLGQSIVEYILLCAMAAGTLMLVKGVWLGKLATFTSAEGNKFRCSGWRATASSSGSTCGAAQQLETHYSSGMGGGGGDRARLDVY